MRVLILSCNTGEGHNSCAKAIREFYIQKNEECEIYDALEFISKFVSDFISNWHVRIYRYFPHLFKIGYKYSEDHPSLFNKKSLVYRLFASGTDKMYDYISEGNFDTIICTHTFAAMMLTNMLEKHPINIKTGFVTTDYTCYPGIEESNLNYYFLADKSLNCEFADLFKNDVNLVASGIPVRQMFYTTVPKEDAKKHFGIDPKMCHLLVMGGSMGCGPIKDMAIKIASKLSDDQYLSVVCGTNKRLYKSLSRKLKNNKNVNIMGYVKEMSLLMDSADLYLTKPGGISVTEAGIKRLPTVLMNTVAGCEEYNKDFFVNIGSSVTNTSKCDISEICISLLNDREKLKKMSASLNDFNNSNSAQIIYNCMKGDAVTAQRCKE